MTEQEKTRVLQSGIIRVYLVVTAVSVVVISAAAGSIGAGLFLGGWVGLFAAVFINELTDGYTMEGSWISGKDGEAENVQQGQWPTVKPRKRTDGDAENYRVTTSWYDDSEGENE